MHLEKTAKLFRLSPNRTCGPINSTGTSGIARSLSSILRKIGPEISRELLDDCHEHAIHLVTLEENIIRHFANS